MVGTGYVGLSNAVLLAQKNELAAFDIDQKPVAMINDRLSPTEDDEIESFWCRNLSASRPPPIRT